MMKSQHNLSGLFRKANEGEIKEDEYIIDGKSSNALLSQTHIVTTDRRTLIDKETEDSNVLYSDTNQTLAETLESGRATVKQLSQQGEQLEHAESLQYQTEYHLDKSARILKGMSSWSGWFSNLISNDVQFQTRSDDPPGKNDNSILSMDDVNNLIEKLGPVEQYTKDDTRQNINVQFPKEAAEMVESIRNYHIHILLLHEHCHTKQEYISCLEACEKLQKQCESEIYKLRQTISDKQGGSLVTDLAKVTSYLAYNLELLSRVFTQYHRKWFPRQHKQVTSRSYSISTRQNDQATASANGDCQLNNRQELFNGKTSSSAPKSISRQENSHVDEISSHESVQMKLKQQDEHLLSLIPQLDELTQLSTSIHSTLQDHTSTVERMDQHSTQLTDKTNHVKRRTHAMIQRNSFLSWSSWYSGPNQKNYELDMIITIQHLSSKKYFSVMGGIHHDDNDRSSSQNVEENQAPREENGIGGGQSTKSDPSSLILTTSDQGDASTWLLLKDKRHCSSLDDLNDNWSLIGLQNVLTQKFLGMNTSWFSGGKNGIVCSADRIAINEQWELEVVTSSTDEEDRSCYSKNFKRKTSKASINQKRSNSTDSWTVRILHGNANSGCGGYIEDVSDVQNIKTSTSKIIIGQSALENGHSASLWQISRIR